MSHQEEANQGTGLRVALALLVKASPERLQSLTFQLGETPEENIIHILCLVVLRREAEALNKIQELQDNCLAPHLSEKLQGGGNLEHFADHCGHLELTGETAIMLARIFKVLSEQGLCDSHVRNLAYQRALSVSGQKVGSEEFIRLFEEAKVVCGPDIAEFKDHDPHRSLGGGNGPMEVSLDQSARAHSLPSPLHASSSEVSYPSQLEISQPPTLSYKEDKKLPDALYDSKVNTSIVLQDEREAKTASSDEPAPFEAKKNVTIDAASLSMKLDSHATPNQGAKPSLVLKLPQHTLTNTSQPNAPVPCEPHESASVEDEDDAVFYAFVILHAPDDVDMADSIRARMEAAIGSRGAVFSEDFAMPGKSALRCVEDAINNSAFSFLLLTRNFRTRMLELKTDSALINSINKEHKYNTVIPLLPRVNPLPRSSIPLVLATIEFLEENDRLERKIKKVMSPAKINKLKKIWTGEQRVKHQLKRQERLKVLNQTQKHLIQEFKTAQLLEEETTRLRDLLLNEEEHGDNQARPQQTTNIHIENAHYIMIGNESQMTVDAGGGADSGDQVDTDRQQEGSE